MLEQIGQLVDDQERRRGLGGMPGHDVEGVAQHLVPVGARPQRVGPQPGVGGDCLGEAPQRGQAPLLPDGGDIQPADRLRQRPQEKRLPVPPPPGHDAQPHGGGGIRDEVGQQPPLAVTVDDVGGLG